MAERTITIPHVYRVEGHGGITVRVDDRGLRSCQMDVFEGARFYEMLLRGRRFHEVPAIVCRVCAICSSAHALCAIAALEDALGLTVSRSVARLRSLLALGGTIESHALHLFCLVAPDYLGFSGVLEMQEHRPDVAQALELKLLGHVIQERIGGRAVHPVNMLIGGVSRWPAPETFAELRDAAATGLRTLRRLEPLVTQLRAEELHPTPRTAVALTRDAEGQLLGLGRELLATGHPPRPVAEFRQHVNEQVVRHSTAKQALYSRAPFMVGALARLLHHGPTLGGEGGQALARLCPEGLVPDPRQNNLAQLVELYHCCEEVMRLCTILGDAPPELPPPLEPPAPGAAVTGTAAIEAPRGTLFHAYQLDAGGQILDADIITPTAQNLAQVELDLGGIVDRWLTEQQPGGDAGLHGELEQLVRAYDPCISCSTHLVNLERQA